MKNINVQTTHCQSSQMGIFSNHQTGLVSCFYFYEEQESAYIQKVLDEIYMCREQRRCMNRDAREGAASGSWLMIQKMKCITASFVL